MIAAGEGPLVSAIIIFLNGERFIAEAIESVLAQSMDRWELLLVDDGSTHPSSTIAQRYRDRFPGKIKYLEHQDHKNLGMSASRNLGIGAARGKYVAFVDADDIWLPGRLERHMQVFDRFPDAVMVCSPTLYWFSWRSPGDDWPMQPDGVGELHQPSGTLLPAASSLVTFLASGCMPCICGLTMRREVILEKRGFENEFRGMYEDQVFVSKMCLAGDIVIFDEVLDYYRQHPDSCCYQAGGIGVETADLEPGRGAFLYWLERYLAEVGCTDQGLWQELQISCGRIGIRAWRRPSE